MQNLAHIEKPFFSSSLGVATNQNDMHDEIKNYSGNACYPLHNFLYRVHIILLTYEDLFLTGKKLQK